MLNYSKTKMSEIQGLKLELGITLPVDLKKLHVLIDIFFESKKGAHRSETIRSE